MRRLALIGVSAILAACSAAGTPSASPDPSTGGASPSRPPVVAGVVFRAWTTQALPPAPTFTWGSAVVIADGQVVVPGLEPMIFPGPLLPGLIERSITPAGVSKVFEAAQAAGLLSGPTDLTGGIAPRGMTGHLLFVLDGRAREVVGDPGRQISVHPGAMHRAVGNARGVRLVLGAGERRGEPCGRPGRPEHPYAPVRLAVLITDPAPSSSDLAPGLAKWATVDPAPIIRDAVRGRDRPLRCGRGSGAPGVPRGRPGRQRAQPVDRRDDGRAGARGPAAAAWRGLALRLTRRRGRGRRGWVSPLRRVGRHARVRLLERVP